MHAQNPFDIPARISEDSLQQEAIENIPSAIDTTENIIADDYDLGIENPFDVSHIPLIKTRKTTNRSKRSKVDKGFFSRHFAFILLIVCMIFVSIVSTANRQYIGQLFNSLLNEASQRIIERNYGTLLSPINILLYIIFFINLALLIYFLLFKKGIIEEGWTNYLKLLGFISAVYIVKHIGIWLVKTIYKLDKYLSRYNAIVYNTNHIIGITLIIANLLILYSFEQLSYIVAILCVVLIVGLYLLRLVKATFMVSPVIATNGFHFFIYLCGFEIIPLLVFWRMITNNVVSI